MGIGDLLSFGKKEIVVFRVPREVAELRHRIEAENRENYPNLARYQEITRDVKLINKILLNIIAQKTHAAEAGKIMEDIKIKLARLTEKIEKNKLEAKREGKQDFLDKNIDYLERKSIRNNAKTIFTDFLEAYESLVACCKEGKAVSAAALDSVTDRLFKDMSELHHNFFKKHGQDLEIRGLRDKVLEKVSALSEFFREHEETLERSGLKSSAGNLLHKLTHAGEMLSETEQPEATGGAPAEQLRKK